MKDDTRKNVISEIKRYMIHDIEIAIKGNANYLAALGLTAYTEQLGGFLIGNMKDGRGNYITFIRKYFSNPEYDNVNSKLSHKGELYTVVRNGLVHQYFMKIDSTVNIRGQGAPPLCGIEYDPAKTSQQLTFYVDVYFEDFKSAFDKYYNELIGITIVTLEDTKDLQSKFDNAIEYLPFPPIDSSTSGLSRLSGSTSYTSYTGRTGS